jgi:hypothetical protein
MPFDKESVCDQVYIASLVNGVAQLDDKLLEVGIEERFSWTRDANRSAKSENVFESDPVICLETAVCVCNS